jgi:hypothetical protein
MDNLGQVPTASGALSTFSNSSATLYGEDTYKLSFKTRLEVKVNVDLSQGFISLQLPITKILAENFLNNFEYYTFEELAIDLQCTSSLGLGSGAMMFAYVTDPLNAAVPTAHADATAKFGNTDGMVIVRPRDSKTLQIPVGVSPMLGGWRYVKSTGDARMESFGAVVALTDVAPAAGDGTAYEAWLRGFAVGKRRTVQTDDKIFFHRQQIADVVTDLEIGPNPVNYFQFNMALHFEGFDAFKKSYVTVILDEPYILDWNFKFTDEDGAERKRTYRVFIDAHPCQADRDYPSFEISLPDVPSNYTWQQPDLVHFSQEVEKNIKGKFFTFASTLEGKASFRSPAARSAIATPLIARNCPPPPIPVDSCIISGKSHTQIHNSIKEYISKN